MTSKERINSAINGIFPDKIPFVPAIYEHKAALIEKKPSEVSRDGELLYQSIIAEHQIYQPDIITVGIDIYNIEAEAIGCKLNYVDGVMVPVIGEHILDSVDLNDLNIPDPNKAGRMPMIIDTAKRVNSKIGDDVYVCVGISGPYSLAASLMGQENLLMSSIENPEYMNKVLVYSLSVIKKYTQSILDCGLEVVVFDSAAAPPFVSPTMYKNSILLLTKDLFDFLKQNGAKFLSYIVGGDTKAILDDMLNTGANNILCDFNADLDLYLTKVREKTVSLRKNINPAIISLNNEEELSIKVSEILNKGRSYPGFILGTGILAYDTPIERVKFIKKLVDAI
jgi:uroporphyrinogen decarboxylase